MWARKLEALDRRLGKMIAKSDESRKKWEPAHKLVKEALDAANEGKHSEALDKVSKFNNMMNEYKILHNV
jgi:hypothetical protein